MYNGGILGSKQNIVSTATASGVFSLEDQYIEKLNSNWPIALPMAPIIGTATANSMNTAEITFTAPLDTGGGPITQYRVTSSPGGLTATGTSSPITVSGLSPLTTYTFTVAAQNSIGYGPESTASNSTTTLAATNYIEYLVIAGGGGGGDANDGGGGGAGGYRSSVVGESSGGGAVAESRIIAALNTDYNVTVGAGGAALSNGSNSIFHTITSIGGGNGAGGTATTPAGIGGSGGGGGDSSGNNAGAAGTSGQGYGGGAYSTDGGGGGGAGGPGRSGGTSPTYAYGGIGVTSSITGTAVARGGGGGGGVDTSGRGVAVAGGGSGGLATANPGTINTGGGGGACGSTGAPSYPGGSGVVILRYDSAFTISLSAGLTGSTSTVGANKVTQITAGTGTVSWSV